uniref:Immunoglobulin V-set domain-containing protein n=1 Tax=Electrophorus electricus TaxID=8005 RepID=A0A4W4F7S6_ELEEL
MADTRKILGPCVLDPQPCSAVTLSCYLSPETSAVSMEIRWFKETDCVCLYKNRQVTEGRGRVSLFTQELHGGNISLQLRSHLLTVISGDRTLEFTVLGNWHQLESDWPWHRSVTSLANFRFSSIILIELHCYIYMSSTSRLPAVHT